MRSCSLDFPCHSPPGANLHFCGSWRYFRPAFLHAIHTGFSKVTCLRLLAFGASDLGRFAGWLPASFFCWCSRNFRTFFSRMASLQSSVLWAALLPLRPALVHFSQGFWGSGLPLSRLRFFGAAFACGLWPLSKYLRACTSVKTTCLRSRFGIESR